MPSVVEVAKAEVGYTEGKNNANKYSAYFHRPPESWCADFVNWCLAQAGQLSAILNSPSCVAIEEWAKKQNLMVPVPTVQANDIVLFDFVHGGKSQHIGIALGYNKNTHLIDTIEGNTSNDNAKSQANGDCVALKHRAPSTVRYVIRPQYRSPK